MAITLQSAESQTNALRAQYLQDRGALALLEKQKDDKQAELLKVKADIETFRQVQILFSKVSEHARKQLKARIEETVTAALQAIFMNDNLQFAIDIRTVNGTPSADWSVISCYGDIKVAASPEDAKGGGVTDVVSLALRLALMELARPRPMGPIILDEPGKMISKEYLPNVAEFLKQYLAKTGRQGIMITHHEALADVADTSWRVSQAEGISTAERG